MTDKINKNDYILLMGDLNAKTGNQKLGKTIRTNGGGQLLIAVETN